MKVSVALTHKQGLMVGARSFTGNPYDGHSLAEQLEQVGILTEDTEAKPKEVTVDLGFRGMDKAKPSVELIHRGKFKLDCTTTPLVQAQAGAGAGHRAPEMR